MSALPQRIPNVTPAARPKLKAVPRIRGYHHGRLKTDVRDKMHRSRWNFERERFDVFRVSSGVCEAAVLTAIHFHSKGAADPRERKAWTPPMLAEDFGKETSFSTQECRECLSELIDAGLVHRKETGELQIDYDAIQKAPKAFKVREGAFGGVDKKGVEKANSADSKAGYAESRATAIAADETEEDDAPLVIEPGATVKVGLSRFESGLSTPITIAPIVRGLFTTYKLTPCSPASISGPQVVSMAAPGAAMPGEATLPFHEDAFAAELGKEGLYVDDELLAQTEKLLACPKDFLLVIVREACAKARRRRTTFTGAILPSLVTEANAKWEKAGAAVRETYAPQPKPAAPQVSHDDAARSVLADPNSTDVDRAWAKGVLGLK